MSAQQNPPPTVSEVHVTPGVGSFPPPASMQMHESDVELSQWSTAEPPSEPLAPAAPPAPLLPPVAPLPPVPPLPPLAPEPPIAPEPPVAPLPPTEPSKGPVPPPPPEEQPRDTKHISISALSDEARVIMIHRHIT
jgi:hypothetical protein